MQAEAYREANGLNDPLPLQYVRWMWGIVTELDFGQSYAYNKPVITGLLRDSLGFKGIINGDYEIGRAHV